MKDFQLNRNYSNYAKFIAAILVAVSHYSTVIVINNHWSNSQFLKLWCQGGYIGVALFFFFSGFGLMESDKKHHLQLTDFIKKRFMNVYLPVLLVSVLWTPIYYLFVSTDTSRLSVWSVIYDLLWGFNDPVLWFVKILFFLYACFYVFTLLYAKRKRVLAQGFFSISVGGATWLAWYYGFPFISVPLFGVGVFASLFNRQQVLRLPVCILLMVAMALVCAVLFVLTKSPDSAHGVVNCAIVIAVVLTICKLDTIVRLSFPQLPNGIISGIYVIYIVHFKVLDFMVTNYGHISFLSFVLVTALVVMIVAYLCKLLKI